MSKNLNIFRTKQYLFFKYKNWFITHINPLSANIIKWSNTLKQFVGNFPTKCLSAFDYFAILALKGLRAWQKKWISGGGSLAITKFSWYCFGDPRIFLGILCDSWRYFDSSFPQILWGSQKVFLLFFVVIQKLYCYERKTFPSDFLLGPCLVERPQCFKVPFLSLKFLSPHSYRQTLKRGSISITWQRTCKKNCFLF